MNLRTLVWRELFERKSQMLTITVGILLGITIVVAIKNITYFSEKAVARELDSLGANVLVLWPQRSNHPSKKGLLLAAAFAAVFGLATVNDRVLFPEVDVISYLADEHSLLLALNPTHSYLL